MLTKYLSQYHQNNNIITRINLLNNPNQLNKLIIKLY